MSKFDEVMDACKAQLEKVGIKFDEELLKKIAKSLGPSIYNKDSSLVAISQPAEMEALKKNFLFGKLGMADEKAVDEVVEKVIDMIGRSNRQKLRPVFYYLLTVELGKQKVFED